MFTQEEIRKVGNKLGWEYVFVQAELNAPDEIIEEFFDEIPILHLYHQGLLSKSITDKFKKIIIYKELQFFKKQGIGFKEIEIPRIPGRRGNNFGFY